MAVTELLGSITAAIPLAKALAGMRDDTLRMEAVNSLLSELNATHLTMSTLIAEKAEMQTLAIQQAQQIRQLEEELADTKRYALRELTRGVLVYRYEPADGDATPAHYACVHCWQDAKKRALLQAIHREHNGTAHEILRCYRCGAEIPDLPPPGPAVAVRPRT